MKRNLIESIIIGVVLTAASYIVGLSFGWLTSVNYLEAFAVFTSYSCTYLCVKERRINYPIGAISTAAYCVLFLQSGLLASAILNAYLTPSLLYGWFRWRNDAATRPVTHLNLRWLPVYLIVTGLAYIGVLLIVGALGATLAVTDSVILIGSILAQFMLDNKVIENWFVWMVVNGFAIYTYFAAGLPVAGVQYVAFFLNSFYGFYEWNRSRNESIRPSNSPAAYAGPLAPDPVRPVLSPNDSNRLDPAF